MLFEAKIDTSIDKNPKNRENNCNKMMKHNKKSRKESSHDKETPQDLVMYDV